jgi:SAM-dependent methyltransferase
MTARSCPICDKIDESFLRFESTLDPARLDEFAFASRKIPEYMHHRLMICRRCDLLYASPIPSANHLAEEYQAAAFDSGEEARHAARTYGQSLPWIQHRLPDREGALDIGAGDGAFLETLLAAGFTDVVGVEPSSAPIVAANASVRPLLRQEIFRPGVFSSSQFSLVCCFQTLEHVTDPLAIVNEAFSILKPGGAVFLIVHNRRALSAKVLGRRSPIFDVEHLQLLSPQSMRHLLERAGFSQVRIWPLVNRYPLRYWMRLFPLPRRAKSRSIALLDALGVGRILLPLPAGNIAAVGFKPPLQVHSAAHIS